MPLGEVLLVVVVICRSITVARVVTILSMVVVLGAKGALTNMVRDMAMFMDNRGDITTNRVIRATVWSSTPLDPSFIHLSEYC